MCNSECVKFIASNINEESIYNKSILEVGALNVNGSPREFIEEFKPKRYVGVDIIQGNGVDEICTVEKLVEKYGKESFDVVITTELLEHVRDWRDAISNLKNVLKPMGKLLITTRSKGQLYHGYPFDFWRYEIEDMEKIFSDMKIVKLEKDPLSPGVFVNVEKNIQFEESDLDSLKLYSIITGKRTLMISDIAFLYSRIILSPLAYLYEKIIPKSLKTIIKKLLVGNNK